MINTRVIKVERNLIKNNKIMLIKFDFSTHFKDLILCAKALYKLITRNSRV